MNEGAYSILARDPKDLAVQLDFWCMQLEEAQETIPRQIRIVEAR